MNRRSLLAWAALAGLPLGLRAQTPPDPLAALRVDQRRAVQAFVRRQGEPGDGSANAEQVIVVDLDGNGQPELAVWWTFYGPTFAYSGLGVLAATAKGWRIAGQSPLTGIVERMSVEGGAIRVDAKTLNKGDPRCCPTKKVVERFRWAGGKLVKA